ncbi:unnamed protein product [Cylicostephanus goldi]|uniref:Uncharacterized protein n=1 Tax=Cylicostephanus goldi TaxID=71465 RepID=A0A3P7NPE7_CYLGO|nr:unnamed protein product [Cylicostephanus goldi]
MDRTSTEGGITDHVRRSGDTAETVLFGGGPGGGGEGGGRLRNRVGDVCFALCGELRVTKDVSQDSIR